MRKVGSLRYKAQGTRDKVQGRSKIQEPRTKKISSSKSQISNKLRSQIGIKCQWQNTVWCFLIFVIWSLFARPAAPFGRGSWFLDLGIYHKAC